MSCMGSIVKFVKYSQDLPLTQRVTGGLTLFTNWRGADP